MEFLIGVVLGAAGYWAYEKYGKDLLSDIKNEMEPDDAPYGDVPAPIPAPTVEEKKPE